VWNDDFRIPLLILEILEPTRGQPRFYSTTFRQGDKFQNRQPTDDDYSKSGFHRGHCVSAANLLDALLVAVTYLYWNIIPMYPLLNMIARLWLEHHLRELASDSGDDEVLIAVHIPIM